MDSCLYGNDGIDKAEAGGLVASFWFFIHVPSYNLALTPKESLRTLAIQ